MEDFEGGNTTADHLCVLVHGLWGNPKHMVNAAKALRAQHSADKVHILIAKSNAGNFTYDGIETGGERVCGEIEQELRDIESRGGKIQKLSIVGYSMGGLVARYAIGLLYARGELDQFECANFTAFASPFLGVRSPHKSTLGHIWNTLGGNVLSASGRQLWGIDSFRDTGRPLLAVLTDPKSIFMSGLRKFKRHTLYSNITNDRSAVFYTTYISKKDPYEDLDRVRCKFVMGYDDVILDPDNPVSFPDDVEIPTETFGEAWARYLKALPMAFAFFVIFLPLGLTVFLASSGIQSVRSPQRIRLHEKGLAGVDSKRYRSLPLWIREARHAVDDAYEQVSAAQPNEYLSPSDDESMTTLDKSDGLNPRLLKQEASIGDQVPTLALAPEQFEMIDSLNKLPWRKFPVWIHKVRHSHAAIIIRMNRDAFVEGKHVLRHWAQTEFLA